MNKIFLFCSIACMAMFSFSSCEDEEWNDSKVTYYATLTLKGDDIIIVDKGVPYTDPGYYAELKGEDVTADVVVDTDLDVNTSGVYTVSYSYVNEDGFAATAERTVGVFDPNDAVEGFYTSDANSYRVSSGNKTVYKGEYNVTVLNNGDGTYTVDDLLGGYYGQRQGYGINYYMQGSISVADDGAVTMLSSLVPGWGDSATAMKDGKWDASTNTLSWDVVYAKMDFYVTLNKVVKE